MIDGARLADFNNKVKKGFAERVDHHLLRFSAALGRKLERADIFELLQRSIS